MNTNNPGPTGSPLVGNTRAAASAATSARTIQKKSWQSSLVTRITLGLTMFLIAWVVQANVEWNLFWKLVAGCGLIFAGGYIQKLPEDLQWQWATILQTAGSAVLLVTVLSSGFAKLAERTVNYLDCVAATGDHNCRTNNNPEHWWETMPVTCGNDYMDYCIGRMADMQLTAGEQSAWIKNYSGSCIQIVGADDTSGEVEFRPTETGPWTTTKINSFWYLRITPKSPRTIHVVRRAGQDACN